MTKLLGAFALLGLTTAVAWADDPDTPAPADEPAAEEVDCSTLEGDEKTACEAKKAEANAEPTEEPAPKGKSLNKSNDNRMESLDDE